MRGHIRATAVSFFNLDFVDVVIHSYRFDLGLAAGDPSLEAMERRPAGAPDIAVPPVTIDGGPHRIRLGRHLSRTHSSAAEGV